MAKEQISLRIPKETKSKLECLSKATGRDKTFLAIEAIEQYCDLQEWQIQAIQQGIKDIENGDYVSHEDLRQEWEQERENYLGKIS